MQTLNMTMIGDVACSTTRTYLTFLKNAGYHLKNLWLLRFNTPQVRSGWDGLSYRVFRSIRRNDVLGSRPDPSPEFRSLCERLMRKAAALPINLFDPFDYESHAENTDYLAVNDYEDIRLQRRILRQQGTVFLYTNGGLVPRSILSKDGVKILHVHPGIVPEVRGSDCFLWSNIVRGRPGASCFYMSPGIDEGQIINTMEFHVPDLSDLLPHLIGGSDDLAYRALLFAIDPQLRGQVLVDSLKHSGTNDLRCLPSQEQAPATRPAYLWMHPKVRLPILSKIAKRVPDHPSGRIIPLENEVGTPA